MKIIKRQFLKYNFFLLLCLFLTKHQSPLAALSLGQENNESGWKNVFREEFLKNLAYVQNIVIQGEAPQETQEFLSHFRNQIDWLDRTLTPASKETDSSLDKLIQQKKALENLVRVQKEAEQRLHKRLKDLIILSPGYSILRLMLLYEVNSLMQQDGGGDIVPSIRISLSNQQKEHIIDKLLQKSSVQIRKPSLVQNTKSCVTKQSLEEKIVSLKALLQEAKEEKLNLKAQHAKKLGIARKENAKLNEAILAINQDLEKAIQDLSILKMQCIDQQNQNKEAQLRLLLTEELADQRLREYSKKKTASTSAEKMLGQEKERLKALELELDQRMTAAKNNKF